jgi:hypothetical protein
MKLSSMRRGSFPAQACGPTRCGTSSTIADDAAALRWAVGGLLASYRARLAQLRCFSTRASLRYVETMGVLLLVIGFALAGHASGQTEPPQPVFDEAACDLPGVSPEIGPRLRCGYQRPAELRQPRRRSIHAGGGRRRASAAAGTSRARRLYQRRPRRSLTVFADHQV